MITNKLRCIRFFIRYYFFLMIGYARTYELHTHYYNQICDEHPAVQAWLDKIGPEKWAQIYDGGLRYGHMTTNLVECINSVLKRARYLPIKALVESTYHRLGKLFAKKGRDAESHIRNNRMFSTVIKDAMEAERELIGRIVIHELDRESLTFVAEEQTR
jgi:hypothetical protein